MKDEQLPLDVTEEVRDFYNRYPYPPPVDNLEKYRGLWDDRQRRRADYHLFWPNRSYREDQSILIAGCGTSQAAKHALRWPAAQITGIDVSETSVQGTRALKEKHNLSNLQVHELAIERVEDLGMTFDQVVCTGVLHHLANPDAGLRALRNVLKPGGAIHLMVYAPYGRTGIYMLQEFCRRIGIHATDGEICDLVSALRLLPPQHPLESLLRQAPDFRDAAALADALLNPQDRAYSVPQLFDFIENAGLTFGRWVRQAPYTLHCGVLAKIPQATRIAHLSLAEQYAAVELFRGTMARHSLVTYRSDVTDVEQVKFSGNNWLDYVPIRMLDTICVQDRLPPQAAAVLINQTHTYTDLFLPIKPLEKQFFDMIDGDRSIAEIVELARSPFSHRTRHLNEVRDLFEKLWWHDQVVFDASRRPQTV